MWGATIIALLFWASAFAGIRAALESYGPGQVALIRFGTASLVLAVYAVVTRMPLPKRRDLPVIVAAGLLGITIYHVALNYGEVTVSAGAAALIISSIPIFTALMGRAWLGERLTGWGWVGILVSFAGVSLIAFSKEGGGFGFNLDAALILLAAVCAAGYIIISKRPLARYGAVEFTTYAIWAGTLPMLIFLPGLIAQIPDATTEATVSGIYLGVFPGAISYVLWSYALARVPASILSAFLYVQPVNAIIIAWIWLGEIPTTLTLIGGAIAVAGVVLLSMMGSRERA